MRLASRLLLALVFSALSVASQLGAQTPGATVSGMVRDSIVSSALGGAIVQLVPATGAGDIRTAVADSFGCYSIADVPDGRYTIGFLHPMLDSLGIQPPLRELYVAGERALREDLGTPSPTRMRAAICGVATPASPDSVAGVVVGSVHDASDGSPIAGARVTARWTELSFTNHGIIRQSPHVTAVAGANGWFALCGVPGAGLIQLVASRGADSTDLLIVQLPAERFLRRELFLGSREHAATARLSGAVVAADGERPIVGAQVRVAGAEARTNERGEWTIADAPAGSRMLEVRAVGFYPERRVVDAVPNARPVSVALSTLKAVLDTVRVTARYNRDKVGFAERSRAKAGRFLTFQDIARRNPAQTSDVFRSMPGLTLLRRDAGPDSLLMRDAFGLCTPAIFLDGVYVPQISPSEIDGLVRPDRVLGIEVYTLSELPAQFRVYQADGNVCGAVIIWTR